jgi:TATA-binding protein-associated factor Taf7
MERPRRDKENRKQPKLKDLKKKKKRLRSQLNDLEKSISLKKDLMNEYANYFIFFGLSFIFFPCFMLLVHSCLF